MWLMSRTLMYEISSARLRVERSARDYYYGGDYDDIDFGFGVKKKNRETVTVGKTIPSETPNRIN